MTQNYSMYKNMNLFVLSLLLIGLGLNAQTEKSTEMTDSMEKAKIEWLSFEEAVEKSKESPKKLFIDVYTSWCHWCKVMDKKTFSHPAIIKHINENYYAVKLDGEQKADIEFSGNTFKFIASGRRGYHELAAALLDGQLSFPSCVIMSEKMERITTIPGFRDPADMETVLKYITEEHYLKMSFQAFSETFSSTLKEPGAAQ